MGRRRVIAELTAGEATTCTFTVRQGSLDIVQDQSRYIEAAFHEVRLHLILGSAQVPGHRAARLKSTEAVLMLFKAQAGRRRPTALDLLFALAQHIDAQELRKRPHDALYSTWFGAGANRKQFAVSILRDMLITVVR